MCVHACMHVCVCNLLNWRYLIIIMDFSPIANGTPVTQCSPFLGQLLAATPTTFEYVIIGKPLPDCLFYFKCDKLKTSTYQSVSPSAGHHEYVGGPVLYRARIMCKYEGGFGCGYTTLKFLVMKPSKYLQRITQLSCTIM